MLSKKNFEEMESYLKKEDASRELLFSKARVVLKNSKAAIYSIHRKELKSAIGYLDECSKIIKELKKIIATYPHFTQNIDNALEEYCEACVSIELSWRIIRPYWRAWKKSCH